MRLALASRGGTVLSLATWAVAIEWLRTLAGRLPGLEVAALILGSLGLALLAAGRSRRALGLGTGRLGTRLLGALALAVVLLLPAAVRWHGGPHLAMGWAAAAVAISVAEELAFRGALFAALELWAGPAAAVLGSTGAWTLAHAAGHPAEFLPSVAAAGLLLGTWRWACRDLVAPLAAHVAADLAL